MMVGLIDCSTVAMSGGVVADLEWIEKARIRVSWRRVVSSLDVGC
jgi:hypothetical protein